MPGQTKPQTVRVRDWLDAHVDREWARPTRVALLPSLRHREVHIKREDELSSGISGSKLRKFASLLPHLVRNGIEEVALLGGPHSNSLVGLLQALKEAAILPWIFYRQAGDRREQGNALLLRMLCDDRQRLIPVDRPRWKEAEAMARAFLDERERQGCRATLVPEGAAIFESLPGAITLAEDLLRNEAVLQRRFDTIFIDSGTGCTAAGLILGLAALDPRAAQRCIHVTLLAGSETAFRSQLDSLGALLRERIPVRDLALPRLSFLRPPFCGSYGSVSPRLFEATRSIASEEGILMDPIYSVKHYLAMRAALQASPPRGPSLFIHSGGALGLCGFQEQLAACGPP